jgi:hypothetical protein
MRRLHPLLALMYYGLIALCMLYGVFWLWLLGFLGHGH